MDVWTQPYHGVSHLEGWHEGSSFRTLPKGYYVTLTDWPGPQVAEGYVLAPGGGFTAAFETRAQGVDAAERVKRALISQLRALGLRK